MSQPTSGGRFRYRLSQSVRRAAGGAKCRNHEELVGHEEVLVEHVYVAMLSQLERRRG